MLAVILAVRLSTLFRARFSLAVPLILAPLCSLQDAPRRQRRRRRTRDRRRRRPHHRYAVMVTAGGERECAGIGDGKEETAGGERECAGIGDGKEEV
jgi:hypothetical protein